VPEKRPSPLHLAKSMDSVAEFQTPLKTSRRFLTLDALRGLGALFVMAGHSGAMLGGWAPAHFAIAVDMFFLLSGFVIAHGYDGRMERGLTAGQFLTARVKRLYPIYLIGLVLGLIAAFVNNAHALSKAQLALTFVLGLFALPSPPMGDQVGAFFPLNNPFWSLFFEFWVANLAYGVFWRWLRGKTLWTIIALSALGVVLVVFKFRTLDTGWSLHTAFGGVARVSFSFFLGVALSRIHAVRPPKLWVPQWVCWLAFIVVLALPLKGMAGHGYELLAVLLFFPALIFWGAETTGGERVGKALGDISYAAYAVHRPLLLLYGAGITKVFGQALPHAENLATQVVFIVAVSLFAWLIDRFTKKKASTGAKQVSVLQAAQLRGADHRPQK
jgi:peptidoglycan/LPS O-acetylase OafA/YrhL